MKRSISLADLPEPAIRVPAGATTLAGDRMGCWDYTLRVKPD
jgi:hypothetical protein